MWSRLFGGGSHKVGHATTDSLDPEAQLHAAYELHEELGRGAYGRVLRATRRENGAEVAVKVIAKGAKEKDDARLQVEVDVLRAVSHPNLIKLYDVYDTKDTLYLVMQLCRGGELFDRIIKRRKFSEEQARATIRALLRAIEHLHTHGVVHRDLKPENILLCTPEDDEIVLTDFGLAKVRNEQLGGPPHADAASRHRLRLARALAFWPSAATRLDLIRELLESDAPRAREASVLADRVFV